MTLNFELRSGDDRANVDFNSDGGDLRAGIAIGKSIRLKSFATTVLEGQRCASACALAWLGGSPRYMGRSALVGFHAAYIKKEGLPSESGVGNALVGSYLTQIGLSETAVVYITQAAPTEMTWLNLRNAKQIGIEVLPFEEQTPATKPAPPIPSRKASDYEECAENAGGEAKSQDALAILLSCVSRNSQRAANEPEATRSTTDDKIGTLTLQVQIRRPLNLSTLKGSTRFRNCKTATDHCARLAKLTTRLHV